MNERKDGPVFGIDEVENFIGSPDFSSPVASENEAALMESEMRKLVVTSMIALGMASVPAIAQNTTTTTAGGGTSTSAPDGSSAGGGTVGEQMREKHAKRSMHRDRAERDQPAETTNSASTHGTGTVYTDRDRATGGVTAGASATGTGDQNASTTVDAYGSTDSTGSTGEVYGDTSASSTNPDTAAEPN